MRPRYENPIDLENEKIVANEIKKRFRLDLKKLPIDYNVDYALMSNSKIRAWAEVKSRSCKSTAYDSYMISLNKILRGLWISQQTDRPLFLFVKWKDLTGYCKIETITGLGWGGREDRNDWQDLEPMCHYPITNFKTL